MASAPGRGLVLATRRSPLALAQTGLVATALRAAGHEVELLELTTTGDRWSAEAQPGMPAPDKGLFVKELEQALLDGRADLAVHSAKDLPADLPHGLEVVAAPARADARDVLVGAPSVDALPMGARVGTGSPRREAQLHALRPDLLVTEIRGNVGTRLAKWERGEVDALVLAAAGLERLGLRPEPSAPLPVTLMTPAVGQGVLAIEARADDARARAAVGVLDDPAARLALVAERAALAAIGGGCLAPLGAHCVVDREEGLVMVGFRSQDALGTAGRRARVSGAPDAPGELGRRLAEALR